MPPDIMAGLFAQAGPPVAGTTAAPPGDPGLAALFAALMAQSGGPSVQTVSALPAPIKSDPLKAATFSSLPPLLPITKPPITNRTTMRPNAPQKASVSAETQNAMDTVPVSVSPKVKTAENKPGSGLPLPVEVKAVALLPLPAFPGFLITPNLSLLPVKAASPNDTVTSAPPAVPTASLPLPVALLPPGLSVPVEAISEPMLLPASAETSAVPLALVKPAVVTLPQAVTVAAALLAAQPEIRPPTGNSAPSLVSLNEQGKIAPAIAALLPALPGAKAQAFALKAATNSEPFGKVSAPALLPMETPQPKITLKSLTAPADNNTRISNGRIQPAPPGKSVPIEVRLQVVGKRSERNAPSALPIVTPSPATTTNAAVTVTAAPLTQTERAEMIRQVAEGVQTIRPAAKAGTAEQMTLQLHPKDWGQLQITVKVVPGVHPDAAQAQAVTAHIVAETPQVKAALENGSSDLRHALRAAGLHLDKLTVTVQAITSSGQAGTASSGGHHLMNGSNGGLGQSQPDSRTAAGSSPPQSASSSFTAWTGHPQDRQQDGQSQTAYSGTYSAKEPEQDEMPERKAASQRSGIGQVDMRA